MVPSLLPQVDYCASCGRETRHAVAVELRQENASGGDPAGYSREPYRVTVCRRCGSKHSKRMAIA